MKRASRTALRRTATRISDQARPAVRASSEAVQESDSQAPREIVLYTADQAAQFLQVRPSWLRRKAAARAVPCRHVGKHLRFFRADIDAIAEASAWPQYRGTSPFR